jgi:hypothetical protein
MTNSQYYSNVMPYSISGTPFAAVFDAADGSSSNPEWYTVIGELVRNGVKPIFNNVSDQVCVIAWVDLFKKLGFMPNILSIKISLAAGISTKEDIFSVFSNHDKWIDQASFRGALGDFLGIHNTQLLPLSMVVSREESTQKFIKIFSNPESIATFLEENNLIN